MYSKEFLELLGLDPAVFDPDCEPNGPIKKISCPGLDIHGGDEESDPMIMDTF